MVPLAEDAWGRIQSKIPQEHLVHHLIPRDEQTKLDKAFVEATVRLEDDVKGSYEDVLRKLMVNAVVRDAFPEVEPSPLPYGCDFSTDWRDRFLSTRHGLEDILLNCTPLMPRLGSLMVDQPVKLLVDVHGLSQRQRDENSLYSPAGFAREIALCAGLAVDALNTGWFTEAVDLVSSTLQDDHDPMSEAEQKAVFRVVEALMRTQLTELVHHTMHVFSSAFVKEELGVASPIFQLSVIVDQSEIKLSPPPAVFEENLVKCIDHLSSACDNIPTVSSWLTGGSTPFKVPVDPSLQDKLKTMLRRAIAQALEPINELIGRLKDSFAFALPGGELEAKIEAFVSAGEEEHEEEGVTFADYQKQVSELAALREQVSDLDSTHMFWLVALDLTLARQTLESQVWLALLFSVFSSSLSALYVLLIACVWID